MVKHQRDEEPSNPLGRVFLYMIEGTRHRRYMTFQHTEMLSSIYWIFLKIKVELHIPQSIIKRNKSHSWKNDTDG